MSILNIAKDAVASVIDSVEGAQRPLPSISAGSFDPITPPILGIEDIDLTSIAGALRASEGTLGGVGVSSVTLPSLTAPAVSAASSVVGFAFDAPVLSPVAYGTPEAPPAPEYETIGDSPNFSPAGYVGQRTVSAPPVTFSAIKDVTDPAFLELTTYVLGQIALTPIAPISLPAVSLSLGSGFSLPPYNNNTAAELAATLEPFLGGKTESQGSAVAAARYISRTYHLMYDAAVERRAVIAKYAASGLSAPTGYATLDATTAAEKFSRQRFDAYDEALRYAVMKVADIYGAAIDAGASLEGKSTQMYTRWAMAPIELARKYNAAAVELHNSLAALYNQQVEVVSKQVSAYRQYAAAVADLNDAEVVAGTQDKYKAQNFGALVDVFQAKARVWAAKNRQYAEKVRASSLPTEAYTIGLATRAIDADIARKNMSMYSEKISTFGATTDLYAQNLQTWSSAYQADASKYDVVKANVSAFGDAGRMEESRLNSYGKYLDTSLSAFNARMAYTDRALRVNENYIQHIKEVTDMARQYGNINKDAVSAYQRADSQLSSAKSAHKLGEYAVKVGAYTTDLAVRGANTQIEVANTTYAQQGDLVRMAAVSSYLQGLYSSVVQSFSADIKYSGDENFNATESLSESTRHGQSHRSSMVTTYNTEGSV